MLRHWFYLLRATAWLSLVFVRASVYFRHKAWLALKLPTPESLSPKEKRRLKHYFFGTTYLSALFCCLRGRGRTPEEKLAFTNLAALACFFDDLVDVSRQTDNNGAIWQDNPEVYGQTADERGLAIHFLHNVYAALPPTDIAGFKDFMHQVFNIETRGAQKHPQAHPPTLEALAQITAGKGGYSVLLFRRALRHSLQPAEQTALYQFGHLIQLCDDIFDVWFDLQEGVVTLATHLLSEQKTAALSQHFEQQVTATQHAFRALRTGKKKRLPNPEGLANADVLGYSNVRVETALRIVHYLVSVTRVCLNHYSNLAEKGPLPLHRRRDMVVDMALWGNRLRAFKQVLSFEF